jgi:predicted nuclease with TOPRIM domain
MSQEPITVTYSLEGILGQITQKLDRLDEKIDKKFDTLQQAITDLKVAQARLEEKLMGEIRALDEKVDGLSKRIDNQEFVNRGILVALVVAILT